MVQQILSEGRPNIAVVESDPFTCGLPVAVVLRLLAGKFSKADYVLYLTTPHWRGKRLEAMSYYNRTCEDTGFPGSQVHHTREGYKHLFREDVGRHLRLLSARAHKHRHGK